MSTGKILLTSAAALWLAWGLVHVGAGVGILANDAQTSVQLVADGEEPDSLEADYPEAAGAIINQHGFNLLWIGLFTMVGAWFVWKQNAIGVFANAIVGGLTDVGYFLFIDLGGRNNFVPGTVMTIVSAAAAILSFVAHFRGHTHHPARGYVE